MSLDRLIGIDVGGSRIKGAVVDPRTGSVEGKLIEYDTPEARTPELMASVVAKIVAGLDCPGPIGVAVPGVMRHGVIEKVANLDQAWEGRNVADLLASAVGGGRTVTVLNDADAAGLAEAHFGEAHGRPGNVLVLTFGTGIGSALVHDGVLVPNTEFGHLTIRGIIAERYATAPIGIRKGRVLSWDEWCIRVGEYLALAGFVVHADLIVVGGGVSEKRLVPHWEGRIESSIPIVPARLKNQAGIIGAALRTRQEN